MATADGLYEEYADLVYKYLCRLSGNRDLAIELTQEAFYQAFRAAHRFQGDAKVSTWLCQIAKHCWYKHLEKQSKQRSVPLGDAPDVSDPSGNPEKLLLESEDRIFLYRQIRLLPDPYKEVVLLRITGELSFSQIAAVMDKSENWARVTFHRAKIMLIERKDKDEM